MEKKKKAYNRETAVVKKKKKEKDANASINKRFRSVGTHTHKCTEKKHERTSDEKKKNTKHS